MTFLSEHDCVFQVKVKQDDHLTVARLVERVLDVVVQDVNLKRVYQILNRWSCGYHHVGSQITDRGRYSNINQ